MCRARRQARGYPSALTDAQWQIIAPHLPQDVPGQAGQAADLAAAPDRRSHLVRGPGRVRLAVPAV